MDCGHEWQRKDGALKERCVKCGTARIWVEGNCSHQWQKREKVSKEDCILCGVSRSILEVHDTKSNTTTPEVN
jgi:hypothetical protein